MMLGAVSESKINCRHERGFYLCRPRTAAETKIFVELQRAIDGIINVLPVFKPIEPSPGQSPIGFSRSGYDGIIGPNTSGLGLTALIGAMQVRKEAGLIDSPSDSLFGERNKILFRVISETQEIPRTKNFAIYAPEITLYLISVWESFQELVELIQRKKAEGERNLFIEAPKPEVIALPKDIASKYKGVGTKYASFGLWGVLAMGLGFIVYKGARGSTEERPYEFMKDFDRG